MTVAQAGTDIPTFARPLNRSAQDRLRRRPCRGPTAIVNPITVFEVISPSSEGYDRGLKFDFYGALDSVREYVLVDQERRRVEVRHRTGPGAPWQHTVVVEESGACPIPSLGFSLAMSRLYRNWEAPA